MARTRVITIRTDADSAVADIDGLEGRVESVAASATQLGTKLSNALFEGTKQADTLAERFDELKRQLAREIELGITDELERAQRLSGFLEKELRQVAASQEDLDAPEIQRAAERFEDFSSGAQRAESIIENTKNEFESLQATLRRQVRLGLIDELDATERQAQFLRNALRQISETSEDIDSDGVQRLAASLQNLENQLQDTGRSSKSARRNVKDFAGDIRGANALSINFSRILQDLPFGFLGIANNIEPAITSLQQFKRNANQAGKSVGSALLNNFTKIQTLIPILGGAITGLAFAFGDDLVDAIGGASNTLSDFRKEADKLSEALIRLRGEGAQGVDFTAESLREALPVLQDQLQEAREELNRLITNDVIGVQDIIGAKSFEELANVLGRLRPGVQVRANTGAVRAQREQIELLESRIERAQTLLSERGKELSFEQQILAAQAEGAGITAERIARLRSGRQTLGDIIVAQRESLRTSEEIANLVSERVKGLENAENAARVLKVALQEGLVTAEQASEIFSNIEFPEEPPTPNFLGFQRPDPPETDGAGGLAEGLPSPDENEEAFADTLVRLNELERQVRAGVRPELDALRAKSRVLTRELRDLAGQGKSNTAEFIQLRSILQGVNQEIETFGQRPSDGLGNISAGQLRGVSNLEQRERRVRASLLRLGRTFKLGVAQVGSRAVRTLSDGLAGVVSLTSALSSEFDKLGPIATRAVKAVTSAIDQVVQKIISATIQAALFSTVFSFLPGGGSFSGAFLGAFGLGGGGGGLGLAEGGAVRGSGTTTSDSIPAMLSDREFVVNAKSAMAAPNLLGLMNDSPRTAARLNDAVTGFGGGGGGLGGAVGAAQQTFGGVTFGKAAAASAQASDARIGGGRSSSNIELAPSVAVDMESFRVSLQKNKRLAGA